jgi:DNA-binding transcriptional MerR regulator
MASVANANTKKTKRPQPGVPCPYRMKDVCALTGLPRQVIHFYIQQGLVPEGNKTGRNMAYYDESHVARIVLIRKLQHERFLPLKAIKAMLDEHEETFSPAQRRLLAEVKERLVGEARPRAARPATTRSAPLLAIAGVGADDLADMVEIGLFVTSEDDTGRTLVAKDDAWMIEMWGQLRAAGFTRDLGFSPTDLAIFEGAISTLFKRESELLARRLVDVRPERVAAMVERALPIINSFLTRYHETKVRTFFATLAADDTHPSSQPGV